ncbi:MAG: hypothetical protein OEY18_12160 [Candidatus Aminicenantes bacterium]|nr:hypothetical protein [Candidatus Aminicenantes bacterium]
MNESVNPYPLPFEGRARLRIGPTTLGVHRIHGFCFVFFGKIELLNRIEEIGITGKYLYCIQKDRKPFIQLLLVFQVICI